MARSSSAVALVLLLAVPRAAALRWASAVKAMAANATAVAPVVLRPLNGTDVASAHVALAHRASQNASLPFDPVQEPEVGSVTTLYFNAVNEQQAQTISTGSYGPAARRTNVWDNKAGGFLPEPSCNLQLKTAISYTENRKRNLHLASMAVCEHLHDYSMHGLPDCGASSGQVCELEVLVPMPNSDEHQEPYIGAAMALAAYSKICSLIPGNQDFNCQVHRSGSAVLAGLKQAGGKVELMGFDIAGILNIELYDAYYLHFDHVYLAEDTRSVYEGTKFYERQHDVLHWDHDPPAIKFCDALACLVSDFINQNR